ncbi:MAG: YraN family protein [Bacteroidales bacterium]
MATSHDLGKQGEEMAASHLTQNGYLILERNWNFGKEEIDIIAQKDNQLVFVEVKTRKTAYYGQPEAFVKKQKQQIIIRAAHAYIVNNNRPEEARFDVIGVIIGAGGRELNHIEDAFAPGG